MYERIEAELNERMNGLIAEAKRVCDEFYNFHHAGNQPRQIDDRSRLGVRVRTRNGYVEIAWLHLRWAKVNGRNKLFSDQIRKGRQFSYPMQRLRKRAQDWEVEKVVETEEKLARVREEYTYLVKAMRNISLAATSAAKENQATESNDTEATKEPKEAS